MSEEIKPTPPVTGSSNSKIFMIGLPVFIIQLVVVYFITANILLDKFKEQYKHEAVLGDLALLDTVKSEEKSKETAPVEFGKFIHTIDDIIVNPANTTGQQLLLTSIAFDLGSEENKKELESKDILVKDLVLSILSSKSVAKLGNNLYKDSLRTEISEKVQGYLPKLKINRIYFSKYIIN
ncbi:MAG: flagellar basal body protein FliL [Ignavibacteriae bacterium HGW-Ignavibacteriae-2]|jgi:flagellar FliL protein|nr:flagellar basal body-associated FliL family protein [Bacteroidota bacterium]PKL89262.1 MAG: flagellar basal body protein FliL [Ignavibacteriae bacterium HGW-Ignavibacteriae-2]